MFVRMVYNFAHSFKYAHMYPGTAPATPSAYQEVSESDIKYLRRKPDIAHHQGTRGIAVNVASLERDGDLGE